MSTNNITHADITRRFVDAFNALHANGTVPSKRAFCLSIGMQPQNFRPVEIGKYTVSVPMLCALVNTYGVNPSWLMTGDGDMFA